VVDFLFIGKTDLFGRLPSLVSKSFNGTNDVVSLESFRQQIIDLRLEQMAFVSIEEIKPEDLKDAIPFLLEKVLFLVGTLEDFKKFESVYEENQLNLAGFIDITASPVIALSLISNAHKYLSLKLKTKEFIDLGRDLNELATKTIEETNKIKDVHQQIVPIRKVEAKGLNIFSKFAAGTSAGGEFFDYSTSDNTVTILVTSTSSYILTSYFLTYMSMLKQAEGPEELKGFIDQVSAEVKSLGMSLEGSSLLFLKIDLKRMTVKGWNFGGCSVHSTGKFYKDKNSYPIDWNFVDQAYFEHQLERKERLYVASKGMRMNSEKIGQSLEDILVPNPELSMDEEFNEIFYQLKKNRSQKFLEFDATLVILEVLENAIFSV
jgi:hypothetical protein